MCCSVEPRDRRYVKGYGFLSFAKYIGKNISSRYSQKLADSAKKSATDAIKTALKRAIQKTAEAAGDLIGNKIADKITNVSKKSSTELQSKELPGEGTAILGYGSKRSSFNKHPLTNFEIQTYYQNEPRFSGVYSRDNLLDKIKDGGICN